MPRGEERRLLLHELAQRQICDSASCPSRQMAHGSGEFTDCKRTRASRSVYLVGAGPGDPDLLTVKALASSNPPM